MSIWQAITLGIVQGVGEFLPISSSAHLYLTPWFLGWQEHSLALDVALHIGTFVAVLLYYWNTWWLIAKSLIWPSQVPNSADYRRLFFLIVIATVPGAVIGFFAEHAVETIFRNPLLMALTLSAMGILLWFADRRAVKNQGTTGRITVLQALCIGVAQGCAVVPGFSRSGTTITAGLFAGLQRKEAANFSFFLSVPITFGAILHSVPKLMHESEALGANFYFAILTSGIVGWLAIAFLMRLVSRISYKPFVVYRLALAALILSVYFLS